jgi:hypothetical protein
MDVHDLLEAALAAPVGPNAQGVLSVVADVLARCVVRPDPHTATLSITLGEKRSVLRVNEDFITREVHDPIDALFVGAHEAEHVLCEHGSIPRIPAVPDAVINIALDIQVNGSILRGLIEPTPGILGRLYRHDRFPELLLRPPTDIIDMLVERDPEARVFAGYTLRRLAGEIDESALCRARVEGILRDHFAGLSGIDRPEALVRAYLDGWCQAQEARSWLLRFIRLLGRDLHLPGWRLVPVLGDHRRRERAKTNQWSRAWGWSRSKHKDDLELDPEPVPARLMERFRLAAQRALQPWLEDAEPPLPVQERSIIPAPGRREQVLRAAGILPVVYEHRSLPPIEPRQMVHLYLDVSGSMARERNWYGNLCRVLGERLAEPVWVWSTEVREATRADVLNGKMPTDGGTCIEPVIEHAIAKGFMRVLVLTDGEFGFEVELLRERVKEVGLEVVFLLLRGRGRPATREDLVSIAWEVMEVGR